MSKINQNNKVLDTKRYPKIYPKTLIFFFLLVESIIYVSFLYIDITNNTAYAISNELKYASIVLCFLFVLVFFNKGKSIDYIDISLLRLAMLFTVVSDLFLLILDYYLLGLTTFSIVQMVYLVRLARVKGLGNESESKREDALIEEEKSSDIQSRGIKKEEIKRVEIKRVEIKRVEIKRKSVIRGRDKRGRDKRGSNELQKDIIIGVARNVIVSLLVIILLRFFHMEVDVLVVVTVFYFCSIVMNVIDAGRHAIKFKSKPTMLFAVGMLLFILCDINVGIFNLSDYVVINNPIFVTIYYFSSIGMWLFYLPAQVCIALSGNVNSSKTTDI